MSYQRHDTGDLLHDYFSDLTVFLNMAPHLLEANSHDMFVLWFSKLEEIDKRALFFYLRSHKDEIAPEYLEYAQTRFRKPILI